MVFSLSIDIEDGVTRRDISMNLRRIAAGIERLDKGPFEEGDSAPIRSLEGDVIGEWEVK